MEFLIYPELEKGLYIVGVNSNAGFDVKSGASVSCIFATRLGFFNGWRGAADSLFNFVAPVDGIYPILLLYFKGTGGGSMEFISVHKREKILINDIDNPNAIKAYPERPSLPFVQTLSPAGRLLTDIVTVALLHGENRQIVDRSIQLLIDGNHAEAEIAASSDGLNITFNNEGFFYGGAHMIQLRYDISRDPVKSVIGRGAFEVAGRQHAVLLDGPIANWRFGESGGNLPHWHLVRQPGVCQRTFGCQGWLTLRSPRFRSGYLA